MVPDLQTLDVNMFLFSPHGVGASSITLHVLKREALT